MLVFAPTALLHQQRPHPFLNAPVAAFTLQQKAITHRSLVAAGLGSRICNPEQSPFTSSTREAGSEELTSNLDVA